MRNKWLAVLFISSALFLMLLFPELTLKGTKNGLLLWYQHFLPAVFPFMILSGLLTAYLEKGGPFFAITAGFLNGYPCGAKTAADLRQRGLLPEKTAPYYAVFCNMSGPMFLASYAGLKKEMPVIYLVSAGLLLLFCQWNTWNSPKRTDRKLIYHIFVRKKVIDKKITREEAKDKQSAQEDYLLNCTGIMVKAGIYIMYFSVLTELLSQPSLLCRPLKILVPFLELTTGITCIQDASFPLPFLERYFRIALCVSGGLCTAFQTREVTHGLDLSLPRYLILKIIQASAVCIACFFFFP